MLRLRLVTDAKKLRWAAWYARENDSPLTSPNKLAGYAREKRERGREKEREREGEEREEREREIWARRVTRERKRLRKSARIPRMRPTKGERVRETERRSRLKRARTAYTRKLMTTWLNVASATRLTAARAKWGWVLTDRLRAHTSRALYTLATLPRRTLFPSQIRRDYWRLSTFFQSLLLAFAEWS